MHSELTGVYWMADSGITASAESCMARMLMPALRCRAGDALSQQAALTQQLREAEEMLHPAGGEADSLDQVLQAVQATVQVLAPCTLSRCICRRHTAYASSFYILQCIESASCLLTRRTAINKALQADEHAAWRHPSWTPPAKEK